MKKLSILTLSLTCLFLSSANSVNTISGRDGNMMEISEQGACGDPSCAYERRDRRTGTIMHFDRYGKLLGRTKG